MVLYGVHPVAELLCRLATERGDAQRGLVLLLARDNAALRRLGGQARALDIPVRAVTVAELSAHCGSGAHRGVALTTAPASAQSAADGGAGRGGRRGVAPSDRRRSVSQGATADRGDSGRQGAARPRGATQGMPAGPPRSSVREAAVTRGTPARHGRVAGRPRAGAGPEPWRDRLAELAQRPGTLVVVADGVSDPVNLGSITRSADQFAADLVLIPRRRAAPVSDTVMRVSAGAAAHVATVAVANIAAALEQLKALGCWIYGADLEGEPVDQVRFPERVALVLGAEGGGLHALVRSRCDHLVRIPTAGQVDSLNVGVAAGILMYEVRRQRRAARRPVSPDRRG